ncbi:hypothetical protein MC7420_737 [Coleofasciculus chthonoplastes PCC 7420]|uniref:Uncharacterized protein n=1 Tax=Coleofasciculus chthonoplastes PCC 7420 TaxID=118168 RepID=B4VTD2_9CYAN|nr:hypothetical protein MC7420_737 [Coleofasciculus chthonoplastes PCC 7420]
MLINTGGSPLPGSPVSFRSIQSCDRSLIPISVNFTGRKDGAPTCR